MAFWRRAKEYCINPITLQPLGRIKRNAKIKGLKLRTDIVFQNREHLNLQHVHQIKTLGLKNVSPDGHLLDVVLKRIQDNPHPNLLRIFGCNKKHLIVELISCPVMIYHQGSKKYDGFKFFVDQKIDSDLLTRFQRQLFDAVTHLHKIGVFHGDIEPNNIVIDAQQNLRLIDFGFALPLDFKEIEDRGLKEKEMIKVREIAHRLEDWKRIC